jgi:DNA-directed RNA polymerase subunit RPC12/RpoP
MLWPDTGASSYDNSGDNRRDGRGRSGIRVFGKRNKGGLIVEHQRRLESNESRCMRCNKLGHTLCGDFTDIHTRSAQQTSTNPSMSRTGSSRSIQEDRQIYCPNCGEAGHHVDFIRADEYQLCVAPRHEAYMKFNQCEFLIVLQPFINLM